MHYKHFKGGIVEVLGTTTPSGTARGGIMMHARHTEVPQEVAIREGWTSDDQWGPLVIYRHVGETQVWARPKEMFNSRLPDGKLRFEPVDLPAITTDSPEEARKKRFATAVDNQGTVKEDDQHAGTVEETRGEDLPGGHGDRKGDGGDHR